MQPPVGRATQQLRRSVHLSHPSAPPSAPEHASATAAQWHAVVRPVYAVDIVSARAVCNYKVSEGTELCVQDAKTTICWPPRNNQSQRRALVFHEHISSQGPE